MSKLKIITPCDCDMVSSVDDNIWAFASEAIEK